MFSILLILSLIGSTDWLLSFHRRVRLTPPITFKIAKWVIIFSSLSNNVFISLKTSMIKIAAVLLFVISSTTALCNPTRHIIHDVHQEVFLKRSFETRQSSCDSIIEDCNDRVISLAQQHDLTTNEGLARFLSDVVVLQCGSCFDEYESFYRCTGDDELAEQLREADCARSDIDGKYCAESLYDGIANGDLPACDEEDDVCVATCQDLLNLRTYWGCCTASFEQHGFLANTTQE